MKQGRHPLGSKLARAAVAALLLAAGSGGSALSLAATGASATSRGDVYPPPVKSRGGALSHCPSTSGLEKFDAPSEGTARADSLRYGRVSLAVDLGDSDRAWRPTVRMMWKLPTHTQPVTAVTVRRVTSASHSGYRVIVRRSCDEALVNRSLTVTVGPRPTPGAPECEACAETVFLLDRYGRALIYYVH
jgi:hypothetical protein